MSSIRLHHKYGVNPTCGVCFFCGETDGTLALLGAAYREEAPMRMILGYEPCDKCKEKMALGITLIECSEEPLNKNQQPITPKNSAFTLYPTGNWFVVRDEFITRTFNDPYAASAISHRKAFIDTSIGEALRKERSAATDDSNIGKNETSEL